MRGSTAGITDGLKGSSRLHYALLTTLDVMLSTVVISPLVVSYWRGTWCLMDHYVFPDRHDYSSYVSLITGLVGILVFTLAQHRLEKCLHPDKHRLLYYTVSRLYTAVFAFCCVNSWRGAWKLLDLYTGLAAYTVWSLTLSSVVILACAKMLRNISAPPFTIVTDRREGYFEVPTLFKTGSKDTWLYVLDCFFSVFIIGTLVVFVWRGFWCLLDIYLFPDREVLSAWGSLTVGYVLVFSTFLTQPLMKSIVTKISGFWRLFAVDIYLIFSFCGTVNVWRGVWNLLNLYLLPETPVRSYWLSHIVCFMLLIFINSSNSILVRGVYIDGEEDGAQCVDFPCYYLRLFFQAKRKKKLLQQLQKRQVAALVRRKSEAAGYTATATQEDSSVDLGHVNHNHHQGKHASIADVV